LIAAVLEGGLSRCISRTGTVGRGSMRHGEQDFPRMTLADGDGHPTDQTDEIPTRPSSRTGIIDHER